MKLEKPYLEKDRLDFIVKYNHNLGKKIEEDEDFMYALEPNEYLVDGMIMVDDVRYEKEQKELEKAYIQTLSIPKAVLMLHVYQQTGKRPQDIEFPVEEQIVFDCSNEIKRTEKLLQYLGLSEDELDELFKNQQ